VRLQEQNTASHSASSGVVVDRERFGSRPGWNKCEQRRRHRSAQPL